MSKYIVHVLYSDGSASETTRHSVEYANLAVEHALKESNVVNVSITKVKM